MSIVERVTRRVKRRLWEDAEQDRLFRQQAIDVYENLVEYLKNGGKFQKIGPSKAVPIDRFTEFEKEESNPLTVKWLDSDFASSKAEYVGKNRDIKLYVLDKAIFDSKREARNAMRLGLQDNAKAFMHEYIHYLDDRRTEFELQNLTRYEPGKDKKMSNYFSDPIEINAYFQAGLAQVQSLLEDPDLRKTFMDQWNRDFRKFKDWFFREHIPLPMQYSHMDEDQKKRLVNRLYGFWQKIDDI